MSPGVIAVQCVIVFNFIIIIMTMHTVTCSFLSSAIDHWRQFDVIIGTVTQLQAVDMVHSDSTDLVQIKSMFATFNTVHPVIENELVSLIS